jgi:hypothetical protein
MVMVPRTARCRATSTSIKTCLPRPHTRTTPKALRNLQVFPGRHLPMRSRIVTSRSRSRSLPRVMPRMPAPTHHRLTTRLLMRATTAHNDKAPTKDTIHMPSSTARRLLLALINLLEVIRNQQPLLPCHPALSRHYGAPPSIHHLAQHRPRHMTSSIANTQVSCPTEGDLTQVLPSLHIPLRHRCPLDHTTPRMTIILFTTGHLVQIRRPHLLHHHPTPAQLHPGFNGIPRMHHCRADLPTMNLPGEPDMSALRATT